MAAEVRDCHYVQLFKNQGRTRYMPMAPAFRERSTTIGSEDTENSLVSVFFEGSMEVCYRQPDLN